jgi:iron complex outermembrane receptor protein
MKRPLVALMALAAALAGSGQYCFRVVEGVHDAGIADCTIRCLDGEGLWTTDTSGFICLRTACDSARIEKAGFLPRNISVAVAGAIGYVKLEWVASELREMEVEPWPRKRDRHALAAAAIVDSGLIAGFERSSLRSAAQWVPGVQWDERGHGGSVRLSIRGSLLRSPYGVRGVKVYWGPFPLTLADGSTPLELLDPMLVGSLDIVRSVGSPMYGSAPSGLLLGNAPFRTEKGPDASIEATGGSNGYYRLGALARTNNGPSSFTAGVVRLRSDGYREQEWTARDQAFIATRFTRKRSTTQVFLTWQQASWALPGSVDEKTAEEDPQAARAYSVLLDAHLDKEQLMGGLANELRLGEHLHIRSGVHAQRIDKTNPYGTSAANCGYKEETVRAVGARLSLGSDRMCTLPTAWDIGLEALYERDHLRELYYVDKVPGDIKVNGDTRVANLNAFATTVTRLGRNTTLHAGVGTERTDYDHNDHVAGTLSKRTTVPQLLPYAGLEQTLGGSYQLHLRYAESVSRATVWELLGSSGSFNNSLRGEHVREWELGASNELAETPVRADFNVFHRLVEDLIMQNQDSEGLTFYSNQEQALIAGCELLVHGPVHQTGTQRVDLLASVAITATDLRRKDPVAGDASLGDIPGIPVITAGLVARANGIALKRLGVEAGSRLIGSTPTGGTATEDKHVEHARISYLFDGKAADISIFLHCENLLDARYSSWIQVNDPGGRFYNPAPGRSFFFGARLTFGGRKARQAD